MPHGRGMLAYVFWHRPRPEVLPSTYEDSLVAFHEALTAARPPWFVRSATFRLGWVPWLAGAGAEVEGASPGDADWYPGKGSAALDQLNESAVGPRCAEAHSTVAACTAAS